MEQTERPRPNWVVVVGVLMVIVGVLGLLGSVHSIFMPKMLTMQQKMMGKIVENRPENDTSKMEIKAAKEMFDEMFEMPSWYPGFAILVGVLSLIASGFYVLSGIILLLMKPWAIRLFYLVIGIKIFLNCLHLAVGISTLSFFALAICMGAGVGIVLHLVLLIVVSISDKRVFST